mgnify:CR=1 FL=1
MPFRERPAARHRAELYTRVIPRKLREIRPAAQFPADIEHALKEHSPRVLQFSGHGNAVKTGPFAGALAFELKDGTISLPDPMSFIELPPASSAATARSS